MPRQARRTTPHKKSPRTAADDYRAKTSGEAARAARHAKHSGAPDPFGDPASGVLLVADSSATGPRATRALRLSLAAVGLDNAYVVWPDANLLETLLSAEPSALVALGPDASRSIDATHYPLVKTPFSDSPEGSWFAWTRGASGLRLPALAPALADDAAKRRFWRAFLALRSLAPKGETPGA